ncbi:ABC transporter ATP-binding protein [Paenibacillus thermoaerophilus]|uniref:ABC transporter ATP-binding protein n=1 Tax=Paenibacillus thermoaerophilus TaxID=1215385 RepID=A0ABW2V112_9BACL|nr:ABC transporter ATP-binding protein [Paenibacillus thermoaerophilus]TMV19066.1 ABC transporter ATP-binding protein [Paenibacillus thermoaerophilus]
MKEALLTVRDLRVSFRMYAGEVQAVRGVNFTVAKGEVLAIVGESGCGKSVTAQTIMRLIPTPPSVIKSGSILFDGKYDLAKLSDREMERIRGSQIGMIFQDPMTSLNPTMTIGKQISETIMKHNRVSKDEAMKRALELLKQVGLSNPEGRLKQYPHELSGGMRQRVMIAMALACNPKLLIADEPTTALDVTIQAQIMDLMRELQSKTGASIILITHDLGVVAESAQRVIVMYAGKVVEEGSVEEVFYEPKHPYTWGLLRSVPRLDTQSDELVPIPGTPPDLYAPPKGCSFAARCPYAMEICLERDPVLADVNAWTEEPGNRLDGAPAGEAKPERTGSADERPHKAACWLLHPDAPRVEQPVEVRRHGG